MTLIEINNQMFPVVLSSHHTFIFILTRITSSLHYFLLILNIERSVTNWEPLTFCHVIPKSDPLLQNFFKWQAEKKQVHNFLLFSGKQSDDSSPRWRWVGRTEKFHLLQTKIWFYFCQQASCDIDNVLPPGSCGELLTAKLPWYDTDTHDVCTHQSFKHKSRPTQEAVSWYEGAERIFVHISKTY